MSTNRKDDHVRLAFHQWRQPTAINQFDEVNFVHHALAGIDRAAVQLNTSFAGSVWNAPLFINAMTGGTPNTGHINHDLAVAARETGVAIAGGSLSAYLKDPTCAETYRVLRRENHDGFIIANINATTSPENAKRAVDLLEANALQIHLNAVQEIVMAEGDRDFSGWAAQIRRICEVVDVPVVVKEVGFGISRETARILCDSGVYAIDVGGRGGTNFARIENDRDNPTDYSFLADWGQSTPACLLDCFGTSHHILASGGVRHPLDVVRALALGATAVGVSGQFLGTLLDSGLPALIKRISTWIEQIAALMAVMGVQNPDDYARRDVVISGGLLEFCNARGIDIRSYGRRSKDLAF